MYAVSCKARSTLPTGGVVAGGGPKAPLAPPARACVCVHIHLCNDAPPNASFSREHRPEAAARRTSVRQWQRRRAHIFNNLENDRVGILNY